MEIIMMVSTDSDYPRNSWPGIVDDSLCYLNELSLHVSVNLFG